MRGITRSLMMIDGRNAVMRFERLFAVAPRLGGEAPRAHELGETEAGAGSSSTIRTRSAVVVVISSSGQARGRMRRMAHNRI